jgi:F0F1-type ATP synthase epsilon subunit
MLHRWFHKILLAVVLLALVFSGHAPVATAQTLSGTLTVLSNRTDLDQDGTLAK